MKREYKIFLKGFKDVPDGYFGPVPGIIDNRYIYCRVKKEDAWIFTKEDAISHVLAMRNKGYSAKCDPPLIVVL